MFIHEVVRRDAMTTANFVDKIEIPTDFSPTEGPLTVFAIMLVYKIAEFHNFSKEIFGTALA